MEDNKETIVKDISEVVEGDEVTQIITSIVDKLPDESEVPSEEVVEEEAQEEEVDICLECVTELAVAGQKFVELIDKAVQKMRNAQDFVRNSDQKISDILHDFELKSLSDEEKIIKADKITEERKERRFWKDIVEALTPIENQLKIQNTKNLLNNLVKEIVRQKRNVEGRHHRTYVYRRPEV